MSGHRVGDRVRLRRSFTHEGEVWVPAHIVGRVVEVYQNEKWPYRVHFEGYSTGFTDGNWLCRDDEIEAAP